MLSTNEIHIRAAKFTEDWKDAHYEKGETQLFSECLSQVFSTRYELSHLTNYFRKAFFAHWHI